MECYLETMIKENIKCCACEGSLKDSDHLNIVTTSKVAVWRFPSSGNVFIPNAPNQAVAVVCDNCIETKVEVKFAVEAEPGFTNVTYHRLEDLEDEPEWVKKAKERLSRPSPIMN